MNRYINDKDYYEIEKDILEHPEYQKLKNYIHHGDNRFNHCIRVSYSSYKKGLRKGLNTTSLARAGLLHDFFFTNNQALPFKHRKYILAHHPEYSCMHAKKYFELTPLEEDIIISHMYPLNKKKPLYPESRLLIHFDRRISIYEGIIIRILNKIRKNS